MPPVNTKGYDIELRKDQECIAVQVKNHKAKCSVAQIEKFQNFLELPLASKFTTGWFISANGYSKPTFTHVETEQPSNFRLGTFSADSIVNWNYPEEGNYPKAEEIEERNIKYIGVFTYKGGVRKTTVAAHLAGAFALIVKCQLTWALPSFW